MCLTMNKIDILDTAFYNLEKQIPLTWNFDFLKEKEIDGTLNITIDNDKFKMLVTIKREVKNHQLLKQIENNNTYKNYLLVAEHLYPKVKNELRENGVNYIESNGNVCIKNQGLFLFIDTNKTAKKQRQKGNRAFTKTGLKVVFNFLLDRELINKTQREIAEKTGVALGNIPLVIKGLLDKNLILKLNKNEYIFNNYEDLLNEWISEYAQTLKPTIFKQRFRFANDNAEWKNLKINKEKTVWGGEPAGDIITKHLRPEKFILYTQETIKELIINYQLTPDNNGDIWAYDMFWNNENNGIAPTELIYADLMLNDDKRSKETAKMIFNEHIKPNL